jgi:hypothetical protein
LETSAKILAGPAAQTGSIFGDSEIFNQLVRTIASSPERSSVMRPIDRISGSFLAVLFAGIALLCGSLLFVTLG